MNTLHGRTNNPDDRTDGPFEPVVRYDVGTNVHSFEGTGYHDVTTTPLEDIDYIVGYEAISGHARMLLDDYVEYGSVSSLIKSASIIEAFPEHFGEISDTQIDEIVAEIFVLENDDDLYDAHELVVHFERLHHRVRQELADRVGDLRTLGELTKVPIIRTYANLQMELHGGTELSVVAALLQDLPKTDK